MRFCTETLGCKVNQYETQALEAILISRGHTLCAPGDGCDVAILNTCAVTAESGRKSRQAVRHMKKLEPGALIAVCGCFAQVSPGEARQTGADLVSGSGNRLLFAGDIERLYHDKTGMERLDDPMKRRVFEELPAGGVAGRTRAMLKIQDGCSNFCSYCIIPYARGPSRSLSLSRAKAEAARLESEGYREIVVTGIEISAYGKDLGGITLADAVRAVCTSAPNARIRLGSLEPVTATETFCRSVSEMPNLCPHFHLSLQSGCDRTLKRMRRRYDAENFLRSVETLRRFFPACGLTADLIVGFPGETDAEFMETLAFIKKCGFSGMHIFPYSRRPGTPAAVMGGQISNALKRERAHLASEAAEAMSGSFAQSCVGSVLNVLFEREEGGISEGHAENYLVVRAKAENIRNHVLPVQITGAKGALLSGEITRTKI